MTCSRIRMPVFLDAHSELTGLARLRVRRHLKSCEACARQWAQWQEERGFCRAGLTVPLWDEETAGLRQAIARGVRVTPQPGARRPAGLGARPKLALAAVFLLAALMAVALFGRPAWHAAAGWWSRTYGKEAACALPPGPNRTPTGDQVTGRAGGK